MTGRINRAVHLISRPRGLPTPDNFALVENALPALGENEVLVRNLFMSVDPYMRGRMAEGASYVPPFPLDQPLTGGAIGQVVASRADGFTAGDMVMSELGWRDYAVGHAHAFTRVRSTLQPLSIYLGAFGMPGFTAWTGLTLANLRPNDIVYVSGAAGAVGNVAGQLAHHRGCRVLGSAGTPEKVRLLMEGCHFDDAFDYRAGPLLEQLQRIAPQGIDVYFDNVGGETLQAALTVLRPRGRIVACGGISAYNNTTPNAGPNNLSNMVTKQLTMRGFIVSDWEEGRPMFEHEMTALLLSGAVRNHETVLHGLDHAVEAFLGLFSGRNIGKMIVDLS